jgi:N6-adenosine-specific RNA methylase IME4
LEALPAIDGGWPCVLADPPWTFKTFSEKGKDRSAEKHYSTMSVQEIEALPVKSIAADDAVLFLWFCWPSLEAAQRVVSAWGFTYKTCAFSWTKVAADGAPVMGTGYWTRSNNESCLLATRGRPKRLNADVRQAILAPRREHSRKPDCVHERIERLVPGPRLELFARQSRPEWTTWGREVTKFGAGAVQWK